MRHVILTEYLVGVVNVPHDNGGGRIIQLAAKDRSELIELAVDDQVWDDFVAMGERIHIARPGDPE